MFRLILNIIICLMLFPNKSALCFLEKEDFYDFISGINKEYYISFFKEQNIDFFVEITKTLVKDKSHLRYQMYFRNQYDLNDKNFLFFKNSIFKEYYKNYFFKNILLIGFGYSILNGPIYFSEIEFSPSLYYVNNGHYQTFSKILIHYTWKYSYQLVKNLYYVQYLTALSSFEHISTKFENSLNFSIKNNIIFLKCSYNVILNENKFNNLLSNINKYISVSFMYCL